VERLLAGHDKIVDAIKADIATLTLFSKVREQPLIKAFISMIGAFSSENALNMAGAWASFMEAFLHTGAPTWYAAVASLTLSDDNPFTRAAERSSLPHLLCSAAQSDLARLFRLASFDICALAFGIAAKLREDGLENAAGHLEEEARALWGEEGNGAAAALWNVPALAAHLRARGAGMLGSYAVFRFDQSLHPVVNFDPVRLADFFAYEEQRETIITNTLRFLEGKAANNILLYGDRGTGKSATVKALCNEYAERGLRLVEIRRNNLVQLPLVMEALSERGLRFIVFIDDLSFESAGDSFTDLKATLEGSIEKQPANVVVYATSNRRHLVRERFSDRASEDGPRAFDTMQEQFSLSDRFGLTIVFTAPDQDEFLHIAEAIALRRGLLKDALSVEQFRANALRWERWFNGRSPRTAVQYVDWVSGGEGFPWE
jgi:predicted AAA+ superfamily ATPase